MGDSHSRVTTLPPGYRVERFEPTDLPPAELTRVAELQQSLKHERVAEDPLTPLEMFVSWMRLPLPGRWRAFFKAHDGSGAVVGWGGVLRKLNDPENQHQLGWEIGVHPAHRRRGVGRALLRQVVEAVAGQGEDFVFAAQATDRVPACEHFARAIGATPGLEMKTSQLDLRAVDRERVAAWAAMSPAGYRLERIDDSVPADMMEPYIEASGALNDMPQGDMRVNPARLTAQQIRDRESAFLQSGDRLWIIVAIHEKTGAGVGFTEATWNPRIPHVVGQIGTAVEKTHRGHRIGLWMKAAMLKRIIEEHPEAKVIRTGNANSNARMLALNTELGFAKAWSLTVWQLTLAAARRAVGLEGSGGSR